MKNLIILISFTYVLTAHNTTVQAQDIAHNHLDELTSKSYGPSITAESNQIKLNNTDSIPDFLLKEDKIMITGTVYESDGVTPAKDVIVEIYQPDENGYYCIKRDSEKRYVFHKAAIKTDADGKYTFYTFIPGIVHRSGMLRHIHPVVKSNDIEEYDLNAFYFDNDPMLTKYRKKRLIKKGREQSILKLTKKDDMYIASRDIILGEDIVSCKR